MKSSVFKYLAGTLLTVSLIACGNSTTDGAAEVSKATTVAPSSENQVLIKGCETGNQDNCKALVENLAKECQNNNVQSCIDIAAIFIKLNEEAVKLQNNELAVQSYNVAVGSLVKACELKNEVACNSLKELSDNIFNSLKTVKQDCAKNNNAETCNVLKEAVKVLESSCQAGRTQDCGYLKELK